MPIADAFLPGSLAGKVLSANASAQTVLMPAGTTLEIQNASGNQTVFVDQDPVTNTPTANVSLSYAILPGQVKVIRKQDGATVLGYIATGNATAYIYGGDGGIGVGGAGGSVTLNGGNLSANQSVTVTSGNITLLGGTANIGQLTPNQSVNITQLGGVTLTPIGGAMPTVSPVNWETVAASQANQVLGGAGAAGDVLDLVTIVPAVTTSVGNVVVRDALGTGITLFTGGNMPSVAPFTIAGPGASVTGNWSLSTGANVSVVARGKFT